MAERPEDGQDLAPCPSTPNCVCSSDSGQAHIAPFPLKADADAAWQTLREILEAEPRVRVVTADGSYLHAVATTRLMRFKDDLEFLLDAEGKTIHIRSASRVGYSDLGANRSRLERLRSKLAERGVIGTL